MNPLQHLLQRRRMTDDLSEEMRQHLEEKIEALVASGMPRDEAVHAARRAFGNITLIEQRSREIWMWPLVESIWTDMKFGVRQLLKTLGMALLAVLTLALGVGANAAMFTVIESVLLRPLPYAHSNRLVFIGPPSDESSFGSTSWLNYRDIRAQSKLLQQVAGYSTDVSVMETKDSSLRIAAPRVTTNLFSMLGVRPLLGRTFRAAEGQTGGPDVVLLSENLWRRSFHADPAILGRTVRIGGEPHTIIGVMPDSFHFPEAVGPAMRTGVWLPLQPTRQMLTNRGYMFFNIVGELRPGVNIVQLQHELDAIASRMRQTDTGTTIAFRAMPYQEAVTGRVRPVLYSLFGALALVLLIACANVSNLLIARSLSRQQEFAVRAALGAGRMRLARQILSEGLTLSLLGCGAGVVFAEAILAAVRKLPQGTVPRADSIAMHWSVVLVLATIAVITTVLSSLLPALLAAGANPQASLQSATGGTGSRSVKGRFSGWLVAGEVALSTLLLVGTGLLFHTLWNLEKSQLGFDATHLTMFTAMPADAAGYSHLSAAANSQNAPVSVATLTYLPVLECIRHLPGVASAALITTPPLSTAGVQSNFAIVDRPTHSRDQAALMSAVSGDYARTMGTPVLRGRMIDDEDVASTPFVAVVNQALARKYFAGTNPLGKQIDLSIMDTRMNQPYTIVGVLADQVEGNVGAEVLPLILLPQQQIPTTSLFYQALLNNAVSFVVKTRGDVPVAAEMRSVFRQIAPGFALDRFQSMQEAIAKNTFSQRLGLYLVGSFAGLAVAMVLVGLYGVLSQLAGYRRHEIGVRMALGATRGNVAYLILRQGSILIGWGLAVGLLLALLMGHWAKSFLYQVQPLDGLTFAAVAIALAAIGLVAIIFPARHAASIDPMAALRAE
ncbi:MAG: ADOP family duplicated permease [Acidobacteriaceae bacterium]